MKPGDKVFVVDGLHLRMTRVIERYSTGRVLVGYHFDASSPGWVVNAADVFVSEQTARDRLAAVLAQRIAKYENTIARLRAIDASTAPVLVRASGEKRLPAVKGGAS